MAPAQTSSSVQATPVSQAKTRIGRIISSGAIIRRNSGNNTSSQPVSSSGIVSSGVVNSTPAVNLSSLNPSTVIYQSNQPVSSTMVYAQPSGQVINGQPINGQPINGQVINGQVINGQPIIYSTPTYVQPAPVATESTGTTYPLYPIYIEK